MGETVSAATCQCRSTAVGLKGAVRNGWKADARNNPGSLLTADIQSVMKYI